MKPDLLSLFNAFPSQLPSAPPSASACVRPAGCVADQVLSPVQAVNPNLSTLKIQTYDIAIRSYRYSASGTGLRAFIANSCDGSSLNVTHKYNMP